MSKQTTPFFWWDFPEDSCQSYQLLLKAVKADGCPVNVGGGNKMEGAIYHLEQLLQSNLQYLICGIHLNELVLRHLMTDIEHGWGFVTDGPYSFKDSLAQ